MNTICIIGLGNMGKPIYECLKKQGEYNVVGFDIDESDPSEKLNHADAFVIAVKPQGFSQLCDSLEVNLSGKLAISIMAGVSAEKIASETSCSRVVRTMPNLPLVTLSGFSGWFANENVTPEDKVLVRGILNAIGEELEVKSEDKLDAITALSGSGPTYFYYLAKSMERKARDFGFSEEDAEKIVAGTFSGASDLYQNEEDSFHMLVKRVRCKGGTTDAALKFFDEQDFNAIVEGAVGAAYSRAKELSH